MKIASAKSYAQAGVCVHVCVRQKFLVSLMPIHMEVWLKTFLSNYVCVVSKRCYIPLILLYS